MMRLVHRCLFVILGAVLGCGSDRETFAPEYDILQPEYGVPTANYRLSGTVVAADDGQPIAGIQVDFTGTEPVLTGQDGSWSISVDGIFPCDERVSDVCQLDVRDLDGPLSGGEFADQTVPLDLDQTAVSQGNWHRGTFEQHDLLIRLEEASRDGQE